MMKQWILTMFALGSTIFSAGVFAQESTDVKKEKVDIFEGLCEIARKSEQPVYSICVIENGVSRTANIHPGNRCQNSYSATKLFTVTAVGILEDKGLIDTEELVYPIFKDQFPEGYDKKWEQVKVSDVLTHKIGFKEGFLDIDVENMTTWGSDDFLYLVLSHPLFYNPGEQRAYSDAAFYLASRIVTAKSGEKLDDLLIRDLFAPMKFSEYAFSKCPYGYPNGATGLYISSEDMAKLGLLYVQRGVYDGKRLLSERFVDKVIKQNFEFYPTGPSGHGYSKGGMRGQLLYMNLKTGLVVAFHTYNGPRAEMMQFIFDHEEE